MEIPVTDCMQEAEGNALITKSKMGNVQVLEIKRWRNREWKKKKRSRE
jgi:hypothetical protein